MLSTTTLLTLTTFCFVASITPGPNNVMLLSSGATFGLRPTVPHILGISFGCALIVLVVGWSIGGIVRRLPGFFSALYVVGTAYLLYLAWRIATSSAPRQADAAARPLGFFGAAAFQWVNPKVWVTIVGAVTTFARPDSLSSDVLIISATLILVGLPSTTLWAIGGAALQRYLRRPLALRIFNYVMAALLVASMLPGLWRELSPHILPEQAGAGADSAAP